MQPTDPVLVAEYAAIAALVRKVGQFTRSWTCKKSTAPRELQQDILDHQRPEGCSIRRGCEVIEMPSSTYYYRSTTQATGLSDERIAELISFIQDEMIGYGYRRVTHELRRGGHVVNHKRDAHIMSASGLGIKQRRRFKATSAVANVHRSGLQHQTTSPRDRLVPPKEFEAH